MHKPGRRRFVSLLPAALLAPALPAGARARVRPRALIKPPRLRPGDVVGLVAPSGHSDDAAIEAAVRHVETLGFRAKEGARLREAWGNYGGPVAARVADLHAMFCDPHVKGIWAVRGGSGCMALLDQLDYALIRRHPKILLGYSDITALHLALHRRAGLVSFHGPVASSHPSDYTHEHLLAVLTDPRPAYTIPMAPQAAPPRTVHAGIATGRLIGGNLSLVAALAGTPYAPDFRHALAFLEEVGEAPYRIDRMLTQLDLASGLRRAAGVMVGVCADCGPPDADPSLTLDETLDVHLQPLSVPAVTGWSFGHIRDQFTLPVGIRARLDTERQTLTLLEPAVR